MPDVALDAIAFKIQKEIATDFQVTTPSRN
jgi:hypothetical protein